MFNSFSYQEKYKLKLNSDIISLQSEWPSLRKQKTINVGKDVGNRNPYTAHYW
jgi:hypothetical protein